MYRQYILIQEHMTNSLRKDSHITQSLWHPQMMYNSGKGASKSERREYHNAPVYNSIGTSVKNPAEISFSGIFNAVAARENLKTQTLELSKVNKLILEETLNFSEVIKHVKKIFLQDENKDKKTLSKNLNNFIDEVVDLFSGSKDASVPTKKILDTDLNKNKFEKIIEYTKNLILSENSNKKLTGEDINKAIKNLIKDATKVLDVVENPRKIYNNPKVQKFLEKAADSQLVFSALFALLLTCTLRPLAIVALPGQKKNNDDKKYAAAHSIASGIIQYIITLIICSPIAAGLKKIGKNPMKFLNKDKSSHLGDITSERFRASKDFNAAKKIVNMVPDVILVIPKAILTIALIPPILKYVFGLQKKKGNNTLNSNACPQNSVAKNSNNTNTVNGGVK